MSQSIAGRFSGQSGGGLLLVGHGTREAAGADEFLALSRLVAEHCRKTPVEPSFLEFARPSIAEGVAALAGRGTRHIVAVPVLLFAAGHIKRDIPLALNEAIAGHAGLTFELAEHLGCQSALVELSARRFCEAASGNPRTALVLVGRGSHDVEATAEMQSFTALRAAATPVDYVRTAFIAMAYPQLEQVLVEVATLPVDRVVVQPHLLFGGILCERIGEIVARFALSYPSVEWIVAPPLGASDLLAAAVVARATDAGAAGD